MKPSFMIPDAEKLINTSVSFRLDYCNALLAGKCPSKALRQGCQAADEDSVPGVRSHYTFPSHTLVAFYPFFLSIFIYFFSTLATSADINNLLMSYLFCLLGQIYIFLIGSLFVQIGHSFHTSVCYQPNNF